MPPTRCPAFSSFLVSTPVVEGHFTGIALYASLGFKEVAVRRGYYRNGDDALIQLRKL